MSTTSTNRSPEEIEREVEQVRAEVRTTLGDIRESLSPGQMLDQGLEYVRHSGGADFTRNLGRQVRDNPLPIALIGAGIGWLLMSDRYGSHGRGYVARHGRTRYTADELYTDPDAHHVHVEDDHDRGYGARAGEMAGEARYRAGEMASGANRRMGEAAHSARERAGGMAQSAGEYAEGVAGGARRMMHDARDRLSEAAHYAADGLHAAGERVRDAGEGMRRYGGRVRHYGERVRGYGSDAQRSMSRMVEEQPTILGAVGFAVGAILGAAIPSSRTEDRLFGTASDRMRDGAREMARDGAREAREAARDVAREARDTLDEHGFSKRGVRDTVEDVADTVKEAIEPKRRDERTNGGATTARGGAGTTGPGAGSGTTSHH